jgi:hypothetical protein
MSSPWSLPIFVTAGLFVVVRAFGSRLFTGTVPARGGLVNEGRDCSED